MSKGYDAQPAYGEPRLN